MSDPGPPAAVTATVTAESHFSSMGAEPQPGISESLPGWGEIPKEVFLPLASSKSLWATQSPVLVVDRIFDGEGVFVREESDVGLRLGQVVEHASVCHALTVCSDRSRGKI